MLEVLNHLDKSFFLFLNGINSQSTDAFMFIISQKAWVWLPLHLLSLYLLFKSKGKNIWLPLLAIIIIIVFSDQIASSIIKPLVQRLRPTHDSSIASLVHIVNGYKGGRYGFVSSHAANSISIAIFLTLVIRKKWFTYLIVGWALLVSYTRIYLGVHYPGDILGGFVVGALVSLVVYYLYRWFEKKYLNELSSI